MKWVHRWIMSGNAFSGQRVLMSSPDLHTDSCQTHCGFTLFTRVYLCNALRLAMLFVFVCLVLCTLYRNKRFPRKLRWEVNLSVITFIQLFDRLPWCTALVCATACPTRKGPPKKKERKVRCLNGRGMDESLQNDVHGLWDTRNLRFRLGKTLSAINIVV